VNKKMYEPIIEIKAKDKWTGVFTTNETIIDEKKEISTLDFCIRKDYETFGVERKRTTDQAERMAEYLKDILWDEGLKITINKNITQKIALNELYVFKLLIMKKPLGDDKK